MAVSRRYVLQITSNDGFEMKQHLAQLGSAVSLTRRKALYETWSKAIYHQITKSVVSPMLRELLADHWSASARGRYIQIRRATQPGSWLYITFLGVTAFVTNYATAHPTMFYFFSALILLETVARIWLVYTPRHFFPDQRFWSRAIYFVVLTTGLVWGAFLAATLLLYGLSSSVTLLILICTIGTTTGSITAYSPALGVLTTFLIFLLIPSMCVELTLDDRLGTALAVLTGVFLAYLLWQGRVLSVIHKRRVAATLLSSKRSKDSLTKLPHGQLN